MTTIIQITTMILGGIPPNPVMIVSVMIAVRAMEISTDPAMMADQVMGISMDPIAIAIQVMETSSTLVLTQEEVAGIVVTGIAAIVSGMGEMVEIGDGFN
jgi:hypothetical protein